MNNGTDSRGETPTPKWTPLTREQRRVIGVLVEKAKTTPGSYPLSLNAVTTGCNQKSNRDPQLDLTSETVEELLESLREAGAVGEVHGGGRVVKYRHYMKDWLGVDGTELAVMAELLLRGAQSVGELRGRAARMAGATLPDVAALRPVIQSLVDKGLVIPLTSSGRGQLVTHALYTESEMDRIKSQHAGLAASSTDRPTSTMANPSQAAATVHSEARLNSSPLPPTASAPNHSSGASSSDDVAGLRFEVEQLRAEVARLKKEIDDIWSNIE